MSSTGTKTTVSYFHEVPGTLSHTPTHLAILGFGTASTTLAKNLRGRGPATIRVWKRQPWNDELQSMATTMGVTLCDTPQAAIEPADLIFSLVPPDAAVQVAEAAANHIRGKSYLDLNAASLRAIEKAEASIRAGGGEFTDGAIMGPLGRQLHRVSTVVSGPHADKVARLLCGWDMQVRAISPRVGLASTVKMIRSVYTKGIEGIVLECLSAAHLFDATEEVLESLEEILELGPFLLPLREMFNELLAEQVEHAPRRAEEMEQVVKTLEQIQVEPRMSRGTLTTLQKIAQKAELARDFSGKPDVSPGSILAAIARVAGPDR